MKLNQIDQILNELIQHQQQKIQECAEGIVPGLTEEDLLQPNDFPQLENHPYFRYEEGVLAGFLTVQMALRASQNEGLL